jgi:hypothetical protein
MVAASPEVLRFLSDGYPPLPMTSGARSEAAGMTEKRGMPATNCGYDALCFTVPAEISISLVGSNGAM